MGVEEVVVDPRCKLSYHTYELRALAAVGRRVRFRRLDCPESNAGMAMVLDGTRVWLHTGDNPGDRPEDAAAWAQVVGRVNTVPDDADGVLALGPLFGIRIWALPGGYAKWPALVRGGSHPRRALESLRFQGITRLPIEAYVPGESDPAYVFSRGRDWRGPHEAVSEPRRRFFEAVRSLGLDAHLEVTDERMDLRTYLEHTRRSALVFNNPAVHGCLGWKLGEFLALGKAIVTVPISDVLPAPIVHGEHAHFVDDDVDAMRDAVEQITKDDDYRRRLELGARRWYDDHMAPSALGERLVGAAAVRRS